MITDLTKKCLECGAAITAKWRKVTCSDECLQKRNVTLTTERDKNNPERKRKNGAAYAKRWPERTRRRHSEWRDKNIEHVREYNRKQYAKRYKKELEQLALKKAATHGQQIIGGAK